MTNATETDPREAPLFARLDQEITFYRKYGKIQQERYVRYTILALVFSTAVPVASLAAGHTFFGATFQDRDAVAVAGVLGAIATLCKSIEAMWGGQKSWLRMAATGERLTTERVLYSARAGPYAEASDRIAVLAERSENIIDSEYKDFGDSQGSGKTSP